MVERSPHQQEAAPLAMGPWRRDDRKQGLQTTPKLVRCTWHEDRVGLGVIGPQTRADGPLQKHRRPHRRSRNGARAEESEEDLLDPR
jgi:hypothetical protein